MRAVQLRHMRRAALIVASTAVASTAAVSCGGAPLAPDVPRPELFELTLVDNQGLPFHAYTLPFGDRVYLRSARLTSVEPGRSVDPRIFEDRSGNGPGGGPSRDSLAASARMADIRVFEERSGSSTTVVGQHTDSTGVTVERRGDLILVRREHPDPLRTVVDTGTVADGKLVMGVREWERFNATPRKVLFQYIITRSTPQ
jgi:hypothetical protein